MDERHVVHTRSSRNSSRIWPIGRSPTDCSGFSAAQPPTRLAGRAMGNPGGWDIERDDAADGDSAVGQHEGTPLADRAKHAPGLVRNSTELRHREVLAALVSEPKCHEMSRRVHRPSRHRHHVQALPCTCSATTTPTTWPASQPSLATNSPPVAQIGG